ncbi:MAG: 2-amino-4-hydroxy-6-hydroxymethyldihydropteridine diphosphokinase [bacterium]|nr:2-amino-4-hydroxy-6-hydroxymethyldihydropteridine diphosphokinase [Gammaproteobacteria bacterium]HIL97070.1 2-amino-4-hydroxy-6-hydroxymethyldihydropteridine diphosphokinase [Pseudomonadales bacterium]
MPMQTPVIIALGSNLDSNFGGPKDNLLAAAGEIQSALDASGCLSSFWQSEPQDMSVGTANFVNAVVEISTSLSARELLDTLHGIEIKMGRPAEHGSNRSRTIDLDIITYGDSQIDEPDLIVPHPQAHARLFVLLPLAELSPELVLPGQTLTVRELIPTAKAMKISRVK